MRSTAAAAYCGLLLASLVAMPAAAQEFGVYLACKGQVVAAGKKLPSHVDLGLRRNSQLAMIQSSDILPMGEKMKLEITPQFYTMTYRAPLQSSVVYHDWLRGRLLIWSPDLKKLETIRISVDRQSAKLEGEMLNAAGATMGRLAMQCEPSDNSSVETPKF